MEQIIDLKDIDTLLENEIKDVMLLDKNEEARNNFLRITKDLKPQKCDTKYGWIGGKFISISCRFTKNGNSEIFKEIINGVSFEEKDKLLNFLLELKPKIFHFNPKFFLDEDEYFYLSFKLEKEKNNE